MTGQSLLLALVLYLLWTAPWCPVFAKAGKRWWVALLPVVNLLVIMRIAQRPWWWVLLLLVPLVGIAVWVVVCLDVAERFGHGVPFTIGLVFLPFFFALWLGLGPDVYTRVRPSPAAVTVPATEPDPETAQETVAAAEPPTDGQADAEPVAAVEAAEADTTEPDTTEPDTTEADAAEPEATVEPEAAEPDEPGQRIGAGE
jgi:hypothetical protein